jgi:hypothetical protein
MRILTMILFAFVVLTAAIPANADIRSVPNSALQMQILTREGTTFVVAVTNRTDDMARFDGIGLYFLPDSTSEEAPQRLGVVSPGQIEVGEGQWKDVGDVVDVAPHRTVKVRLTSYCIDEKRGGPRELTRYSLASRRMPSQLVTALAGAARTAESSAKHGQATALTQQAVWKVRGAMPVTLVGDTRPTSHTPSVRSSDNHSAE